MREKEEEGGDRGSDNKMDMGPEEQNLAEEQPIVNDEREIFGRDQEAGGIPEDGEVDGRGSQEETQNKIPKELEEEQMMTTVKNYKGIKTRSSTGAVMRDLRSTRTPPYSRTLYRAQAAGLGSSDRDYWSIHCQCYVQGCSTKGTKCNVEADEGEDCSGADQEVRGWKRPPPWPPPATWRTTRILN